LKPSNANYTNPRIDCVNEKADATTGVVKVDTKKLVWVGSMFLFGTIGSSATYSGSAALLFVVSTLLTLCLGHSLGIHRRFIHCSYDCPKWLEYGFVHLGVLVGLAGPLGMLYTHDSRDWSQRQNRCHNYFSHQEVWFRDLWWQLFCKIELVNPPVLEIESSIRSDRIIVWMEKYWMWQQLPWAILFFAIGDWAWVFWGICSRVSISILGHWFVGYFVHNRGSRRWHVPDAAVQGYNVPFAALLTMGESWHNNQHTYPGSMKLGLKQGEWDPGWWVLLLLRRTGLVYNLKTELSFAKRGDLELV